MELRSGSNLSVPLEPIERLLKVADAVELAADSETARWFQTGIAAYLSDKECRTLDDILELASGGVGKLSAKRTYQKQLRNSFLKQAFEMVDPESSATKRCENLALAIRDFQARFWPKLKEMDQPPANSSELRRLLFLAMKTGEPLPSSWRTVWKTVFDF